MKQEDEEASNPLDCENERKRRKGKIYSSGKTGSADKKGPLGPLLILKFAAFSFTSNWLLELVPVSSSTAIIGA